ncbi:hypothetical protein HRbin30_02122 [bacterium HR30]|nr:hypothetical protein HRbin30_02122 [bacterium HR30]
MSPYLRIAVVVIAVGVSTVPFAGTAHVPWLRPVLLQVVRDADCIIAGRVVAAEAGPRGQGVVRFDQPNSWCEYALPAPLLVRTRTALPEHSWYVLFVRQDSAGWQDVAPPGVVFVLDRQDQQVVHRALRQLWKHARTGTGVSPTQAFLQLLEAQNPSWRYHAALALHGSRSRLDHQQRAQLRRLLSREDDEALRHLLQQITDGEPASAE